MNWPLIWTCLLGALAVVDTIGTVRSAVFGKPNLVAGFLAVLFSILFIQRLTSHSY